MKVVYHVCVHKLQCACVCVCLRICLCADVTHYIVSYRVLGSIVAFPNDACSHQPGNSGAGELQVGPSVVQTSHSPVDFNEALDQ